MRRSVNKKDGNDCTIVDHWLTIDGPSQDLISCRAVSGRTIRSDWQRLHHKSRPPKLISATVKTEAQAGVRKLRVALKNI